MFRIGYAVNGFAEWDRRGMIKGLGEPGTWNGSDFRSPSVLAFGDYLLLAVEGWSDPFTPAGIGLMIGLDRWLKPGRETMEFHGTSPSPQYLEIGNHGAGLLEVYGFSTSHPDFVVDDPGRTLVLTSAEKLLVPVYYRPQEMRTPSFGRLTVYSNSIPGQASDVFLYGF